MTQAFNLAQLANNLNTSGQLDASDGLSGVMPVANGGTGQSALTANNVLLGNGTSGVQFVAPGASGNVLSSNGTTWVSASADVFGVNQTWNTYNSSQRAMGTTYTNSTGKAIMVMAQTSANPYSYTDAYVNGTQLSRQGSGGGGYSQFSNITWVVPNGATYRADVINGGWASWAEFR